MTQMMMMMMVAVLAFPRRERNTCLTQCAGEGEAVEEENSLRQ